MAAKATAALPEGDEWMYEVKWDGFRMLIIKHDDDTQLLSRNEKNHTQEFATIADGAKSLRAHSAVLDGELVALKADGRPSFQALQQRKTAKPYLAYYAFDLLHLNGRDLRNEPLEKRRSLLREVIDGSQVRYSAELPGTLPEIVRQVHAFGLEGVVAKRRGSTYVPGERSSAWVKIKLSPEQEFVVGGFRPGARGVDSLLVGYYVGRDLLFASNVRQGLNPRNRVQLHQALKPLVRAECPFANLPAKKRSSWGEGITAASMHEYRWVEPRLVVQIAFVEWTANDQLRHSAYRGLRPDKVAAEVIREAP